VIEWKKFDPKNPPQVNKEYLVSDGKHVDVAWIHDFFDMIRWYPPDTSNIDFDDITHYALINLPTNNSE
jgi:hypothetical protein